MSPQPGTGSKLGLFGGSFDPPHFGHLLAAQAAREELGLDRIYFIPAAQSPFKPANAHAPAPTRLRLLRLALAGRADCEIDDQEIRRGGVSYTIDTVRQVAKAHPGASLHLLIGGDQPAQLAAWRDAAELAKLVTFVIIPRPGEPPLALPDGFRGSVLRGWPMAISSSEIRARVKAGASIAAMTPAAVAEAIRNNRLYL